MYPRLRDLREDADMTQAQVAKYLQMSQTGYSKYETGENDIPTQTLIKLAALYKCSVDYLLGVSDKRLKKVRPAVCGADIILSYASSRPMRTPMAEAIMRPRVQPEESPRAWRPGTLVLKLVSILTLLE